MYGKSNKVPYNQYLVFLVGGFNTKNFIQPPINSLLQNISCTLRNCLIDLLTEIQSKLRSLDVLHVSYNMMYDYNTKITLPL